jgi:hypothetical protein
MAEYIKREAAVKAVEKYGLTNGVVWGRHTGLAICIASEIADIPAADVAPVVHGRWAHLGGDEWCCSACGFVITTEGSWDKPTKKYCEDCGAKMDGGDSE